MPFRAQECLAAKNARPTTTTLWPMAASFMYAAAPSGLGKPWLWTLASGYHHDRTPAHGYETTRKVAMAAFAKSWPRQ